MVLKHIITMKSEGQAPLREANINIVSWKWLHHLIETLGEHRISSEESLVENRVENILHVKQMVWWRNIDPKLEIIDCKCTLDHDIFSAQGSKLLPRIWAMNNLPMTRTSVNGLPLAFYDSVWLLQLMECQLEILLAFKVIFLWKKVVIT